MKKKFKIFGILTILLFFVYFLISSNIGNNQNKYINIIDDLLSQNTKNFLKETIFIFKYQKILKKELADKDMQLADKDKQLADKEKLLVDKEKQLADKEKLLVDKEKLLVDKEKQLAERNKQIINLVNDSSLILGRSRSDTKGTQKRVVRGDELGAIKFRGSDNLAFRDAAKITAVADNNWDYTSQQNISASLVFKTYSKSNESICLNVKKYIIKSDDYYFVIYFFDKCTCVFP